jgi:predicted DNA-binding transcriptional regulator AlpA
MTAPISPGALAYNVRQFCGVVGMGTRTFWKLIKRGDRPPLTRIGRRTLVRREAADKWLKDREEKTAVNEAEGGFFAIDRRCWAQACSLGLNPAVAYLIQARGTQRDNTTTSWSNTAIRRHAGIRYRSAAEALAMLLQDGLARQTKGGTRPQYELVPWSEHPCFDSRPPLESWDKRLIESGLNDIDRSDRTRARRLVQDGWLREINPFKFVRAADPDPTPDLIWLPNTIIDGVGNEAPPVMRLRQTQDVMLLRLFIDLYGAQHLADDGGIRPDVLWQKYERHKVGESGPFTVWGFKSAGWHANGCDIVSPHYTKSSEKPWSEFWARNTKLVQLGLLVFVPHLRESDEASAENIHPYGQRGDKTNIEDRLGAGAHLAGQALLTDGQSEWATRNALWLAPVPHHMDKVAMVGIARLQYRPKTSVSAAWQAGLNDLGERFLAQYEAIKNRDLGRMATAGAA